MKRTIIFGDIHGCYDEWRSLLDLVKAKKEDRLISVGDLIFKGPYSEKCLDLAMSLPNLKCVLGNHDDYFLQSYQNRALKEKRKSIASPFEAFGKNTKKYWKFISKWPLYIETKNYIVVHAGVRPDIKMKEQNRKDLLYLRELNDEGVAWHSKYNGDKLIVYGHWARQGLKVKSNSIGLDTGCVYGKKLSALILPEREIVSVKAKKVYCPIS